MYQVLRKHSDAEHPLTTNQIRALMEKEHGISMHRTTVPGDIEVLKAAGFNVVGRRARQNKYYLAEGDFELAELKILIDAVESSRFITEKKSGELIEKLSSLTSEQNARKLRRHIFTTGRVRSLNEKCWYIIDAFNEAINEGRQVSFHYTDIDGRKRVVLRNHGRPYIISPYTLLWNGDFYYLLGFDHNKGEMRTYRVDRIADQPQILKEAADPVPEDFDLGRYTREVFRMFDNEELQEVDLLCSYEVMKGVVDQFGMDIKIKRAGTGWFGLRVTVCTSATFYAWVFQWAGRIRIMGPEKAREEYRQMAMKALEE
ncbi:MAG: WYL domain-containing protein [Lachnospiraceae bacterium]|nr:WYL domain-containing protein [Lachnospiraceae bacterium]